MQVELNSIAVSAALSLYSCFSNFLIRVFSSEGKGNSKFPKFSDIFNVSTGSPVILRNTMKYIGQFKHIYTIGGGHTGQKVKVKRSKGIKTLRGLRTQRDLRYTRI